MNTIIPTNDYRTIWISDIHLGTRGCKAEILLDFLKHNQAETLYLVDYFHLQGMLRWSLILLFMIVKAGLIVAVFMHMRWERLALMYAILIPPVLVLVFVGLMTFEADYTVLTRGIFFAAGS